jgi:hypothetical protein
MKYDILHRTRYAYASPVRDSFNDVRLQPMPIPEQTVESFPAEGAAGRAAHAFQGFLFQLGQSL